MVLSRCLGTCPPGNTRGPLRSHNNLYRIPTTSKDHIYGNSYMTYWIWLTVYTMHHSGVALQKLYVGFVRDLWPAALQGPRGRLEIRGYGFLGGLVVLTHMIHTEETCNILCYCYCPRVLCTVYANSKVCAPLNATLGRSLFAEETRGH